MWWCVNLPSIESHSPQAIWSWHRGSHQESPWSPVPGAPGGQTHLRTTRQGVQRLPGEVSGGLCGQGGDCLLEGIRGEDYNHFQVISQDWDWNTNQTFILYQGEWGVQNWPDSDKSVPDLLQRDCGSEGSAACGPDVWVSHKPFQYQSLVDSVQDPSGSLNIPQNLLTSFPCSGQRSCLI